MYILFVQYHKTKKSNSVPFVKKKTFENIIDIGFSYGEISSHLIVFLNVI